LPRLFGTNGVRGIVNEDMNIELASNLGMAIGTYLAGGKVAIGTDTRTSKDMLKSAVISGLLSTGSSIVDLEVVPTPVLQYYVKCSVARHGVVITASHNPPRFNGIKCIDGDGTELSREEEEKLETIYFGKTFKKVPWDMIGIVEQEVNAIEPYIKGVRKHIDAKAVMKAGPKVVLDCGNGAGSLVSPYLLERIGCKVVTLNAHPQGTFPGHESEPTPENLEDLIKATINFGADVGIAHDGDSDRTIFIDEKGNYLYGDRILALVAQEMLRENNGGVIVTTVASSLALGDVTKDNKGEIIYTKVGSPIVARKMMEKNSIFGGEENGGLIFPKHQYCRDGGMAAAKVVEIIAKRGKTLSELIAELPKYQLYKTKVQCPHEKKEVALKEFARSIEGMEIDETDGVKILMEGAWVLVRPSGTEPIYRIFAEAKDSIKARELAEQNKKIIEDIIENIP
jgi:phosphomannomutase/phosphoglucomutase